MPTRGLIYCYIKLKHFLKKLKCWFLIFNKKMFVTSWQKLVKSHQKVYLLRLFILPTYGNNAFNCANLLLSFCGWPLTNYCKVAGSFGSVFLYIFFFSFQFSNFFPSCCFCLFAHCFRALVCRGNCHCHSLPALSALQFFLWATVFTLWP